MERSQPLWGSRIAVVFPGLVGGGVEVMMPTLAAGLHAHGLEVDMVVAKASGEKHIPDANIPIHLLETRNAVTTTFRLVHYLQTREPEVLISGPVIMNLTAILAAKRVRRRPLVIITERGNLSCDIRREHRKSLKMQSIPHLMRLLYRFADGIVAPSPAPFDDPLFKETVNVNTLPHAIIPNPLRSEFRYDLADTITRSAPRQERSLPMLLAIGRLAEQKGHDTLLRAVARLSRIGIAVDLTILGEGPLRIMLNDLAGELGIADHVTMPGYVLDPRPYFRQADIFVMPSRWEAFGNAKLEAMASRKPMVLSKAVAESGGDIVDGENALVVPVDDSAALAKAINRLISCPALSNAIADNAWKTSRKYTSTATAEKYVEFICQIMNGSPTRSSG